PHNRVSCALATVGPGGRPQLWFGTEGGGLVRESEGRWTAVGLRQGLPYPTVNCLFRTVDRRFGEVIWAGLRSQGLAGWKPDGSWIRFTSADGLPNENITALQEIHVPSGRRELWAGSFGKGMARLTLDDPQARWRPVTVEGRPVQDIVQSILQGPRGNVYVYTLHGILRIDRDRLETPGPLPATVFDQEDGLPSEQINPRSGFLDRRGRLWAGTTSGLACLDPSEVILDRTPKPLQLQASLISKGRTQPLASGIRLPYRAGSLGFQFTLVDFFKTSAHRYQSLLEGLEDRPTAWSPAASREFTNLPPGTYTFKVWGLDASGNVSGPVAFPFSVRPALWQTPWFIGLVLVAVAAAASVAMRWRERLLHRRNQELSALVLSRTQDLLHTNQRLQEEAREREQAERAKADFVAAVSHELRTPLTSIRGSLGMLAGGVSGDLPAPAHNLVDIAHRNTVKLLSLVDDLLDHQKVEAGRMELSLAPVELNAFLHQAVEDHTGYAESFGVTCQIIGPGRPAWILGDLQRLHQVLANLLSNATKYATLDKRIRITLKVKGPLARIEVFNPGEPIPETFRARIFQPFEQADQGNTRTARGTGL
ncbi:MAG TPA: histidine kinase dimerization/phospho-acceptor domain-containing protein, partial [Holophagaceae bacterium]